MTKAYKLICLFEVVLLALTGSINLRPTAALDRAGKQKVMQAVVQLGPVADVTTKKGVEVRFFGWGSGTIISKDGYILTNYHVIDVTDVIEEVSKQKNVKIREGELVVLITKRSDQPPVASFIAEVIQGSPELDLAVLRIKSDLSGNAVDLESLDLPFVELGDSDVIDLGDNINVFGYPGIGGNTITFTSGNVSGFDSEDGIEGRAWIKTDAAIAGGNSGGTGTDDDGNLIGVPTRIFSSKDGQFVDCRRLADTNGDGKIDDTDSCIPVGAFINALRPVNLSKALIEEARGGSGDEPLPNPKPVVTDGVKISGVIIDADTGKPIPNAVFVVLQEGLTWADYDNKDEQILDAVQADRNGAFETSIGVTRGKTYSMGWGAKGYQAVREDDVEIKSSWPDVIEVKLKLQKQ